MFVFLSLYDGKMGLFSAVTCLVLCFVLELHIVFWLLCDCFPRSLIAAVLFDGTGIAGACLLKPEAAGMIFGEAQCCYKAKVR